MAIVAIPRSLGPVPLSVVVRERHESALEVTRNPVEFGADVADHAYLLPKRLELEAVTADGSLNEAAIAASYEALLGLQAQREPFDVVTGLHLYRNMLIERIEVDRDKRFARLLYFRAELIEVIIVDTETTSGPGEGGRGTKQSGLSKGRLEKGATVDRGSPTVQRGNTATRAAPTVGNTPEAVQNRSILRSILN